jgi:hypothetical protein
MKKFVFTAMALVVTTAMFSQEVLKHKWHQFYIGGNKGYFTKTHQFTATTMTENQFGSGSQFDNSPMEIAVAEIYTAGAEERVILDYTDSNYYVLVFKNFTPQKASVSMNTDAFKTMEEAKQYVPAEESFSDWYTPAGYKAANAKPAMPEMTKKDAVALATYMANAYTKVKETIEAKPKSDNEFEGLGLALMLSTLPANYAESKGFNPHKSLAVIDRGMKKYRKDPAVLKIFKDAGIDKL